MFWPRVHDRRLFTALLLGLVVLAWLALWGWGQSPYGRFLDHEKLAEVEIGLNGGALLVAVVFVSGWTLMTFAMMLPTSLPLVQLFRRMTRRRTDSARLVVLLIAGYLSVWALFGVVAHAGDRGLHEVVARTAWLEANAWVIGAATVAVAGAYQFTPLKYQCLDKCRSPLSFIAEHWRGSHDQAEAFRLGVHHGIFCVGCCWSLMLLMFAVGVGSLGWMLALGAVMAVEKNMPWGRRISAPLGVGLIAGAMALVLMMATQACAHHVGCG
jgi:predicted metal-binding membrane protein